MSGCFGNSAEDQYFERQLNRYLDNVDSDDDESNNEPDYDAIDNVDSEESVMKDNHE